MKIFYEAKMIVSIVIQVSRKMLTPIGSPFHGNKLRFFEKKSPSITVGVLTKKFNSANDGHVTQNIDF